jgi:hypothetical protein
MSDKIPHDIFSDPSMPSVELKLSGDSSDVKVSFIKGCVEITDAPLKGCHRDVISITSYDQVDALISLLEYARLAAFPDAPSRISGFTISIGA